MARTHDNFDIALDALDKGLVAIPCRRGTKIPTICWKEYQEKLPTVELLREWFHRECNIAIITTGMVVFDCDDPTKRDLVIEKCGETSHVLQSPRGGFHLGYRRRRGVELTNQVKIKGLNIDIRTNGGIEMIPNSETEDGRYEWLTEGLKPIAELPVANIGWTRTRVKKRMQTITEELCDSNAIQFRGRKYIDTFDRRAISGHRGHTALFVAALKIVSFVRKLGGTEADAWQLLLYCNATKCDPPWDVTIAAEERALRHKFEDALKKAR